MKTEKSKTPFTYINAINAGKDIEIEDNTYNQFLTNRGLSLHLDTLSIANEINKYKDIPNQVHFNFLRSLVTPRNRWSKWPKPKKHGDASIVSQYYGISIAKAYDLIKVMDTEQIEEIRKELEVNE